MKGTPFHAASLHEPGRRAYNEDWLYPKDAQDLNGIFMVCDGVGLSTRGDVAAKLVCERFPVHYLNASTAEPAERLAEALRLTEADLRKRIQDEPALAGTATTMTFVDLRQHPLVVAWAGDSRVYHIRNGRIHFVSKDHSVVADLIARGDITPSEARHHPRRNVITKAVMGDIPTEISTAVLADVRQGDYILLCSDGVAGCLNDAIIEQLFGAGRHVDSIKGDIDELCKAQSGDNYTMWLVELTGREWGSARKRARGALMAGLLLAAVLAVVAVLLLPRGGQDSSEVQQNVLPADAPVEAPVRSSLLPPESRPPAADTMASDSAD